MSHAFNFKLGCEVPEYEFAKILADGIKQFDDEAEIHIKESQTDDFWELTAHFFLESKTGLEAYVIGTIFEKSVAQVGGRRL